MDLCSDTPWSPTRGAADLIAYAHSAGPRFRERGLKGRGSKIRQKPTPNPPKTDFWTSEMTFFDFFKVVGKNILFTIFFVFGGKISMEK